MKSIIVFFAFAVFTVMSFDDYGIPTRDCPAGEHTVLYCPQRAEPNCDNPTLHDLEIAACDIADCFCNEPTVRDTSTGQCVELSKCPKKKN